MKKTILMLAITTSVMSMVSGVELANPKNENRIIEKDCASFAIDNETIWEGNAAGKEVPDCCKIQFVKTVGHIQPMTVHPKVATYGELEVLETIKKIKEGSDIQLIDIRIDADYEFNSIKEAVNIAELDVTSKDLFPEDHEEAMNRMGVTLKENTYNFDNAKTIVLFCNGIWCSQSPRMIKFLIKLGYPAEKIKWYRGGVQSWMSVSLPTVKREG